MSSSDFRTVFLPYCLQKQQDGSYALLNRNYKPLGVEGSNWVEYSAFPCMVRFKRALSAQQIAALDCNGRTDGDCIYLYSDGSIPTSSESAWQAYSERLQRLAAYRLADQD